MDEAFSSDGIYGIYNKLLKPEACANCAKEQLPGSQTRLLLCSRCKSIKYCNADCQLQHWRSKHKEANECARLADARTAWIEAAESDMECEEATKLFISAGRMALGQDGDPRDVKLAIEWYEKAADMDEPIDGGHPVAMLHLALHYDRGIGVPQDDARAFYWYRKVVEHPGQMGNENIQPAMAALSRFYREGLGGVEQSDELATKYHVLSQSNPESAEEYRQLSGWWEDNKTEMLARHKT
jgi:TPR repeat protein